MMKSGFSLSDEQERSTLAPLPPLGAAEPERGLATGMTGRRLRFRRVEAEEAASEGREEQVRKLDDIRVAIGDRVQLESRADGSKYFVQLIGFARGASVMVGTPVQGERAVLVRDGQNFVVRLFAGRGVFAFPATVLRAVSSPFAHIHLSYPAEVRGFVLRETERVDVELIASVTARHVGPVAANIDNLGPGGARFLSRVSLGKPGDPLQLKFRVSLNGREQLMGVRSVLRAVAERRDDTQSLIEHRVQFVELDALQTTVLEAYVYRRLLDERA